MNRRFYKWVLKVIRHLWIHTGCRNTIATIGALRAISTAAHVLTQPAAATSSGGVQVRCGCHCPWGEGAGPDQMVTWLLGPGGNVGVLSHFYPLCFLLLYAHSSPQQHLKCSSGHPIPQPVNPSHPVRFCSEEITYCPKVLALLDRTLRPVQQMRLGGDNNDVVRPL